MTEFNSYELLGLSWEMKYFWSMYMYHMPWPIRYTLNSFLYLLPESLAPQIPWNFFSWQWLKETMYHLKVECTIISHLRIRVPLIILHMQWVHVICAHVKNSDSYVSWLCALLWDDAKLWIFLYRIWRLYLTCTHVCTRCSKSYTFLS